jgi:hypothetical protein
MKPCPFLRTISWLYMINQNIPSDTFILSFCTFNNLVVNHFLNLVLYLSTFIKATIFFCSEPIILTTILPVSLYMVFFYLPFIFPKKLTFSNCTPHWTKTQISLNYRCCIFFPLLIVVSLLCEFPWFLTIHPLCIFKLLCHIRFWATVQIYIIIREGPPTYFQNKNPFRTHLVLVSFPLPNTVPDMEQALKNYWLNY